MENSVSDGTPYCTIQWFSIKGPRGCESYFSYFKQPIGDGMSAQDMATWAKWKVKLFRVWAGSLSSECGNTGGSGPDQKLWLVIDEVKGISFF